MTTPHLINSIGRSPSRRGFPVVLLALALTLFALSPAARAVTPAPDGGYPGNNTAEGHNALSSLTTGVANTAVGFSALFHNTIGRDNTATGSTALYKNTTGIDNTANGVDALYSNTTGSYNTAIGVDALASNTTGFDNTVIGKEALSSNTTGNVNTAIGASALITNTRGGDNTAIGFQALPNNTTGNYNTAIGEIALSANRTGSYNTALGYGAGMNHTTGDNNIDIGNAGGLSDTNTIRIGAGQMATFIAGIYNVNEGGTILPVYINSDGQLGTQAPSSSRRFKKEIKPMDKSSEAILSLKPVTFHYKSDKTDMAQFGLIAEEVADVNPDLVVRDEKGDIYTVRYDAVNAMLLNEFLKEHETVQELKSVAVKQEGMIARQEKQIEALTAGLQKVSAQLELSKSAPKSVKNDD